MKKRKSFGSECNLLPDANEIILVQRMSAWICSDTLECTKKNPTNKTNKRKIFKVWINLFLGALVWASECANSQQTAQTRKQSSLTQLELKTFIWNRHFSRIEFGRSNCVRVCTDEMCKFSGIHFAILCGARKRFSYTNRGGVHQSNAKTIFSSFDAL